jgi:6-hydroxycyclohex-1-ene-1-carbonyl-CoA dehydrogenase
MSSVADGYAYYLVEPGRRLERRELGPMEPGPGEVVVQVAGCGVCHTDTAFATGTVAPRGDLPLVLGHEIVGTVVAAGRESEEWQDREVLVPASIPCGACPACIVRRPTSCRQQYMPGNDGPGGYASHVRVPSRGLCPVPDELPAGVELSDLAVVTDAVATTYEAILRSELGYNDVAVFVGAGGLGGFGVQISNTMGAAVVAIDVDPERLALASEHGARLVLDAHDNTFKQMKSAVRDFAARHGKNAVGIKVFETSGNVEGQATAYGLMDYGGYLGVVGYTPESIGIRLSKLMAMDATAKGNWGCPPWRYPEALGLVLTRRVSLGPYIRKYPLEDAPDVLEAACRNEIRPRPILVPQG